MRTREIARWSVLCLGAVIATAVRAAEPPALVIEPDTALAAPLTGPYLKIIDDYTAYWAKAMLDAKADDAVTTAKGKFFTRDVSIGYNRYESAHFKSAFAASADKALQSVLDAKGPLKGVLQVNAGQAIAAMPQLAALPDLEKMTTHADAAVRYYGWLACRNIMPQAVAGSKDVAQKIFTMLGERIGKETSGPALGLMLQMLNMSGTDMASASDDFKKLAATEPYAILTKNWPVLCRAVLAGHEQTALAAHDGAHAMLFLYSQAGQDKARVKVVLQGMADMMWCAALAFDRALVASKDAEGAAKTEAEARVETMTQLLMDIESDLGSAVGKKNTFVQTALSDLKAKDRGAAVQLAVVAWVEALKDSGVVQPAFTAPPVQASAPAGGPK